MKRPRYCVCVVSYGGGGGEMGGKMRSAAFSLGEPWPQAFLM